MLQRYLDYYDCSKQSFLEYIFSRITKYDPNYHLWSYSDYVYDLIFMDLRHFTVAEGDAILRNYIGIIKSSMDQCDLKEMFCTFAEDVITYLYNEDNNTQSTLDRTEEVPKGSDTVDGYFELDATEEESKEVPVEPLVDNDYRTEFKRVCNYYWYKEYQDAIMEQINFGLLERLGAKFTIKEGDNYHFLYQVRLATLFSNDFISEDVFKEFWSLDESVRTYVTIGENGELKHIIDSLDAPLFVESNSFTLDDMEVHGLYASNRDVGKLSGLFENYEYVTTLGDILKATYCPLIRIYPEDSKGVFKYLITSREPYYDRSTSVNEDLKFTTGDLVLRLLVGIYYKDQHEYLHSVCNPSLFLIGNRFANVDSIRQLTLDKILEFIDLTRGMIGDTISVEHKSINGKSYTVLT